MVNNRIEVQVNNIRRREVIGNITGQKGMSIAPLTGNVVAEFDAQVLSPVIKELADCLRRKSPDFVQKAMPKPRLCQF
jgi:hypothetical protein